MSSAIDPEAATPSVPQAFEQSDRNPPVTNSAGQMPEAGSCRLRLVRRAE